MGINIFAKTADATASGGGNYARDGIYTFAVEKIFVKEGDSVCFIAELRVLEAAPSPDHPEIKPNQVGSTISFVQNFTKHDKTAPGNTKAFGLGVLGGCGYTEDQVTQELLATMAQPSNPMRGAKLRGSTYRKTTKETKKEITLMNWSSIEGQTVESIKAGRVQLDATAAVPATTPAVASTAPAPAPVTGALAGLLG